MYVDMYLLLKPIVKVLCIFHVLPTVTSMYRVYGFDHFQKRDKVRMFFFSTSVKRDLNIPCLFQLDWFTRKKQEIRSYWFFHGLTVRSVLFKMGVSRDLDLPFFRHCIGFQRNFRTGTRWLLVALNNRFSRNSLEKP